MHYSLFFLFFILTVFIKQAFAIDNQPSYEQIQQIVTEHLLEKHPSTDSKKTRITVAKLDPRIVIQPCELPLIATSPDKNKVRNINVKVSCEGEKPWKLYISTKVEITEAVLIAAKTISKGDVLDASNVELAFIGVNKLRGERLNDTSIVFGGKAKRRITKGKTISKNSICLICKGDVVTITASSESFSIKTQGVALSSGNINDQIRVKNTRSNKVITPRIKAVNQVVINL